ncbi:hypothetical protein RF11_14565 [Thelohanellus kitauei]|uniref:Uncharacterized protein n=1 Tax=Thelohanellus kitauei TaxID=669202 RepID=A0A0C2MHD7_THEKT|nr:hypothetical protein RF11_14565 [Thelohanellus kitauei]
MPDIYRILKFDLKIILDKLANEFNFTDIDYFVAVCYFRRLESVISQINADSENVYFDMNSLNDDAQYLTHTQLVQIKNKVYLSKRLLDQDIKAYCQLLKDGKISSIHDLLETTLKVTLKDDNISKIVRTYVMNYIEVLVSPTGKSFLPC